MDLHGARIVYSYFSDVCEHSFHCIRAKSRSEPQNFGVPVRYAIVVVSENYEYSDRVKKDGKNDRQDQVGLL